ncbi:MAG TPA: FecR family protein, partial [Cyclobacteriaceae bacterium]|nr:FecR family protein [Cyclobacteriaceae bacterium]
IHQIDNWFAKILDEHFELNEREKTQINDRMLAAIRRQLPSAKERRGNKPSSFLMFKIAAGLLLTCLVGYLLSSRNFTIGSNNEIVQQETSAEVMEHARNTTAEILTIQLPDASIVELKPDAEISYAKTWKSQKREVHLTGEAFFDVKKDSQKPFFVYGGGIVTRVLGTSFTVKAAANAESIEVSVQTGKVSVYESAGAESSTSIHHDASGVVLTPNEKVKYFVSNKHWVTSLVEIPRPLPASNKVVDFVFNNTPLSDIRTLIEKTYSIDIILENEASDFCTFTGDVSMMELYDLLNVICKSTGTNYEVKGTKILITGRACQ